GSGAHWVDIGGMRQGFGSVETTEIYQEGLQLRSLKVYDAGKRNDTPWQVIHDNLRFPEAALGDLRAQVACCQLGVRRFGELITRYGRSTVDACIRRSGTRPTARCAPSSQKFRTGPTRRKAFSTMTAAISTASFASRSRW